MGYYKVIALSVGGLGNKIFESGEYVSTENFAPEGRAEELVKQGFLKEVSEKEATDAKESKPDSSSPEAPAAHDLPTLLKKKRKELEALAPEGLKHEWEALNNKDLSQYIFNKQSEKEATDAKTIDQVEEDFLKAELKEAGIPFEEDASKEDLFALWTLSKEEK